MSMCAQGVYLFISSIYIFFFQVEKADYEVMKDLE